MNWTIDRRKPRRSLRTILSVWLVVFSIVPLAFVSFYSISKFQETLDLELRTRLDGHGREVELIVDSLMTELQTSQDVIIRDPRLSLALGLSDKTMLRDWISDALKSRTRPTSISVYSRSGRLLLTGRADNSGRVSFSEPSSLTVVSIALARLQRLGGQESRTFTELSDPNKISLSYLSRITGRNGNPVGFIDQENRWSQADLKKISERVRVGVALMSPENKILLSSDSKLKVKVPSESGRLVKGFVQDIPSAFLTKAVKFGESRLDLLLFLPEVSSQQSLRELVITFLGTTAAVAFFLILTIFLTSKNILRPLLDLIESINQMEVQKSVRELPVKSDTEVGLLTRSYNRMAQTVLQSRADLEKKLEELSKAHSELQKTQTQLVHSSKMVSLGQLVAGVAHELNNPIGFIYSNMNQLKEYSDRLLEYAEVCENRPQEAQRKKIELDIDYIKTDIPKLIQSCVDGAQRTRDIVLSLRTFSRLEEASIKSIDLVEALQGTLSLLKPEMKNRIEVHLEAQNIPKISCYASELNQVFMNILSNAIQAIPNKGTIWISVLGVDLQASNPFVLVSIQDSGAGMSGEVISKIFDPFFSTKEVGKGTGLGLSISYGIIEKHKGSIQVRSILGLGTEFRVMIPTSISS